MNIPIRVSPVIRQSPIANMSSVLNVQQDISAQVAVPACCVQACVPTPLGLICTCAVGGCD